jgi:hypothetical protein
VRGLLVCDADVHEHASSFHRAASNGGNSSEI